jgi:DNA modification methylase
MGAEGTVDRLILGDALEVLRTLPDASVDAIVTDPPSGTSFMGAAWDHHKGGRQAWIAWLAAIMREGLRVLKAGGHALVWALPRTSHWTATALEDAGFEVRDVLVHVFGQGFPKSASITNALGDAVCQCQSPRPQPTPQHQRQSGTLAGQSQPQDSGVWPLCPRCCLPIIPKGLGTALKPAQEHWILCRKPLAEQTVAGQVLATGTGALNIDGSRVEGQKPSVPQPAFNSPTGRVYGFQAGIGRNGSMSGDSQGRWPPNFLLTHSAACDDVCAPDCPVAVLDQQSGHTESSDRTRHYGAFKSVAKGMEYAHDTSGYADEGGASRFFPTFRYAAKPGRSERDEGVDVPEQDYEHSGPRGHGLNGDGTPRAASRPRANHHPTVKGVELMRWLCRLVTPPGGVVLDMFAGSGTTGVAAIAEGLHFLGIEQEQEYYAIAHSRLEHVLTTPVQRGLFAEAVQA